MHRFLIIIFSFLFGFSLIRVVAAPEYPALSINTFVDVLSTIDFDFNMFYESIMRLLRTYSKFFLSIPNCTSCDMGELSASIWGILFGPLDVLISLIRDFSSLFYSFFSAFSKLLS